MNHQSIIQASTDLQLQLKAGDQIIATDVAYFTYNEEIRKRRVLSQRVGDIIMVNNPHVTRDKDGAVLRTGDSVGGNGIHDGPGREGRSSIGLGCSLKVGTFRMASANDPGFMATSEFWERALCSERVQSFVYGVIALLCLGYVALTSLPAIQH